MKRLNGFSLMEMMIVLTIVAIVAAASAPMVNKKMVRAASEKSPWIFTNGESIAYNLDNPNGIQDNKTARIGSGSDAPNGVHPRLYITTNSDATPHIMFGRNDNSNLMRLTAGGEGANLWLNNRVVPNEAIATVALGWNSNAPSNRSVAVGMDSDAQSTGSVAMGNRAKARANVSIAIGDGAQAGFEGGNDANKYATIAIGSESIARPVRSIAIGRHAEATGSGSIAMGSSGDDNEDNRARAKEAQSVALGQSALAEQNGAVALGGNASAKGVQSIALGQGAFAEQNGAVALGGTASVAGNGTDSIAVGQHASILNAAANAIAIGRNAQASGESSISLGSTFITSPSLDPTSPVAGGLGAIAIGSATATGTRSIAIGQTIKYKPLFKSAKNRLVSATNTDTIAIGSGAQATSASSVAIGRNAQATAENSVAIGRGAIARGANNIVLGDDDSIVYIPGRLVVNKTAVLGYADGDFTNWGSVAIIRSNRDGKMEILQRDGDGDWDAVFANGRVNWDWAAVVKSDRRLKNISKEFTSGLDKIKKLEVFNYTFKDDKNKTPRVGVMAQDLQKVFPDAVVKGEDGFLRIRMEDMFYAVINAIKELDNRTSLQEKKIKELEKRIEELEKRL